MEMNQYQEAAMSTAVFRKEHQYIYPALKLAGEAGEVAEKVGKVLRDKESNFEDPDIREELAKELGDVLWYIAALANSLGFDLDYIAKRNILKLAERKTRNVIHGNGDNR